MIVCGMGNIGPWVFAEILRDLAEVGQDWQVAVLNDGRRDVIELRVELDNIGRLPEVERQVRANLRERFPDFWKNYEMKLYELRVTAHERKSLRGGRKLRRMLDERQMLIRRVS